MADRDQPKLLNQLYTYAQWFVTPVHAPSRPDERRRAMLLSAIMLLILLTTVVNSVTRWILGDIEHVSDISMVISFFMYVISRTASYPIASRTITALCTATPYILLLLIPNFSDFGTLLFIAALTVLLASYFTSLLFTINIGLLNIIMTYNQYSSISDANPQQALRIIPYVAIFFVVVLLWSYYNYYESRQKNRELAQTREESARIFKIADLLPEPMIFVVAEQIIYANQRARKILQVDPGVLIEGRPAKQYLQLGVEPVQRIDSDSGTFSLRQRIIVQPEGSSAYPMNAIISMVPYSGTLGALYTLHHEADEMWLFQRIMESALLPAMVTTPPGENGLKIVYANPALCEKTGYSSSELLGADYTIFVGPQTDAGFVRTAQITIERGDRFTEIEAIHYTRSGEPFHGIWQVRGLKMQDTVTHYLFTLRDTSVLAEIRNPLLSDIDQQELVADIMSDYTYALEVSPDKVLRFLWISGAYERITGRTLDSLMQQAGWANMLYPDDRTAYRLRHVALLEGESRTLEYRVLHLDGSIRWVQDRARPVLDSAGNVVQIIGAAHDITERIKAQEALKAHVVQQAVVAELGLLALSYDNRDTLIQHTVVLCEQVLDGSYCMATAYDSEDRCMRVIAVSQMHVLLQVGDIISIDPQQSLAGYTLAYGEPVVSENLRHETRFASLAPILNAGMISGIAIVIHGAQEAFGVLSIYSDRIRRFNDDDIYFLQSVANVLSTFVERSRAQQAEREQREFAEALRDATVAINSRLELPEVLRRILESLKHVVPQHETSLIQLLDDVSQTFRFVSYLGVPTEAVQLLDADSFTDRDMPLLTKMASTRKPLIIDDVDHEPEWVKTNTIENIISYVGAPIMVEDRCIGFIHLNSSQLAAFSSEDGERLQIFADKMGNAILNARRADELDRMVKVRTAELKQEREQLEAMLSSTGEGIFYTENDYILFANQAFAEMTGYEMSELIGAFTSKIYPPTMSQRDQQKMQSIANSIKRGEIWRDEIVIMRADGSLFDAGLTVTRVGGPNLETQRAVAIVRDISAEKELERLQTRFIANAAHELRSPITNLNTRMYLIRRQPDSLPVQMKVLEEVIARMNRLVADLLDFSYIHNGNLVIRQESMIIQDVIQAISRVLDAEAEQKQITLQTEIPLEPIQIWGDPHRLEQVFVNLVNNAINYTPAGGTITILVNCQDNQTVMIGVRDTGEGIPAEDIQHIFQPFYRVEHQQTKKGTGLGLSISKEIVELHGGKLSVESELSVGSTFFVTLPLLEG